MERPTLCELIADLQSKGFGYEDIAVELRDELAGKVPKAILRRYVLRLTRRGER